MEFSSGDALAAALPDLGSELGSLDWFGYMDLDLDEFWDGADVGSFLPVPAGKEVGSGLDLADSDGGGRESSPDSVVTDDGAPSSESAGDSGDDGREMSRYVSELERFLMEDGDDDGDESVGLVPTAAKEDLDLATDEYFLGGYYVADDGCSEPGAGAGVDDAGKIGAEDHYFIDDFYAAHDGLAEPAAGAGVDNSLTLGAEEEIAADDYFFDNDFYVVDDGFADAEPVGLEELAAGDEYLFDDGFSAADDGCAEPAAGVVDPASPDDDEEEDDGFAAREDEATSRKRARYE